MTIARTLDRRYHEARDALLAALTREQEPVAWVSEGTLREIAASDEWPSCHVWASKERSPINTVALILASQEKNDED